MHRNSTTVISCKRSVWLTLDEQLTPCFTPLHLAMTNPWQLFFFSSDVEECLKSSEIVVTKSQPIKKDSCYFKMELSSLNPEQTVITAPIMHTGLEGSAELCFLSHVTKSHHFFTTQYSGRHLKSRSNSIHLQLFLFI